MRVRELTFEILDAALQCLRFALEADSLLVLLVPLPAPGVTRRRWPLDAVALLPRQASI